MKVNSDVRALIMRKPDGSIVSTVFTFFRLVFPFISSKTTSQCDLS